MRPAIKRKFSDFSSLTKRQKRCIIIDRKLTTIALKVLLLGAEKEKRKTLEFEMKLKKNVTIEDLARFFGETFDFSDWYLADPDPKELSEIDPQIIDLISPERGLNPASGEDAFIGLEYHKSCILLGPEAFLAFMEKKELIPDSWKPNNEEQIVYIRFYGRRLVNDILGEDAVLAVFFYLGQWLTDIQSMGDAVDGSELGAVVMNWRLQMETENES